MNLELTRRSFFRGAAAFAAAGAARSYAAAVGAGKPNLKFGVLSDIHVSPAEYMKRYLKGDPSFHRPRETDLFEKALRYFDERGADAVILAGDLADWGLGGQMKAGLRHHRKKADRFERHRFSAGIRAGNDQRIEGAAE